MGRPPLQPCRVPRGALQAALRQTAVYLFQRRTDRKELFVCGGFYLVLRAELFHTAGDRVKLMPNILRELVKRRKSLLAIHPAPPFSPSAGSAWQRRPANAHAALLRSAAPTSRVASIIPPRPAANALRPDRAPESRTRPQRARDSCHPSRRRRPSRRRDHCRRNRRRRASAFPTFQPPQTLEKRSLDAGGGAGAKGAGTEDANDAKRKDPLA